MPNNKRKSLRSVIKGRSSKPSMLQSSSSGIHPNSRKALQLNRVISRSHKIAKKKSEFKGKVTQPKVERYLWFASAISEDEKFLSRDKMHDLIASYINRNDEELNQLQNQSRKNRPKKPKEIWLQALKDKELQEYKSGFAIPDLSDPKTCELLRKWNGDYNFISLFKECNLVVRDLK